MHNRNDTNIEELQKWAAELWDKGCLQGDLARTHPEDLTSDEVAMLECLREGFIVGQYASNDKL